MSKETESFPALTKTQSEAPLSSLTAIVMSPELPPTHGPIPDPDLGRCLAPGSATTSVVDTRRSSGMMANMPDSPAPDRQTTPSEYSSQSDYIKWVQEDAAARCQAVARALLEAFAGHIERREVDVIVFSGVSATELAAAILKHPLVLKPLLASCNIAGRAIKRDLGIKNVDTYEPALSELEAAALAGYLISFLPAYVEIPALVIVDKCEFVDKEIRKKKGQWEILVAAELNRHADRAFRKRKFSSDGEEFEIDAASPEQDTIEYAVDIKRIEASQDIHKRCDEIINKADKFRRSFPNGQFAAVIYYPFVTAQVNVLSRLRSDNIAAVVFAGETRNSVETAIRLLLGKLGISR
jgi:hypothetical protein